MGAPPVASTLLPVAADTGGLPFTVEVEVASMATDPVFATAPSVHSMAFAVSPNTGRWLIIGGRTNGFHGFTATANFPRAYANDTIYVIDPIGTTEGYVWRYPVANLSADEAIRDQFIATNFQYALDDDGVFYVSGGYGVESVTLDTTVTADSMVVTSDTTLVTYPMLTTMNLDSVIAAVMAGDDPSPLFTFTTDTLFQVTGGELQHLDGAFWLIFGNKFTGPYLSCVEHPERTDICRQDYTNAIRPFVVDRSSGTPVVTWGPAQIDSANFHRRDLTVAPTVFSDGSLGIGAYSGVFVPPQATQADASLPYLYPVYIGMPNQSAAVVLHPAVAPQVRTRIESGQAVQLPSGGTIPDSIWRDDSFLQRMNQYSAANLLMYDPTTKTMYTTLFGGIGHYVLDGAYIVSTGYPPGLQIVGNETIFNDRAPFIPYITTQVRSTLASGRMVTEERVHGTPLPGFLGGEAKFVPAPTLAQAGQMYMGTPEVLDFSKLTGRTFVGWIFGGMEATVEAAWPDWKSYGQFDSRATTKVMRVYVTPNPAP
jgi:hypothetical protein